MSRADTIISPLQSTCENVLYSSKPQDHDSILVSSTASLWFPITSILFHIFYTHTSSFASILILSIPAFSSKAIY